MPIRTNRGRAAVYRRLWGWPLRSPRHLAGVAVTLTVLVVAIGIALPKLLGDNTSNAQQPGPSSSAVATRGNGQQPPAQQGPMPTRLTEPRESPPPAAAAPEALTVAKQWAAAWVNHPEGMTNQQWLEGLRPYTTEEYLPELSTVELPNIPASAVTGEATAGRSYTSSVEALVPTDGPKLVITVVHANSGWRVTKHERAD